MVFLALVVGHGYDLAYELGEFPPEQLHVLLLLADLSQLVVLDKERFLRRRP